MLTQYNRLQGPDTSLSYHLTSSWKKYVSLFKQFYLQNMW